MPVTVLCPDPTFELSTDGTAWTDVTAWVSRVDPQARERPQFTYQTFAGTYSCAGPLGPLDIELEAMYSEADTAEPYGIIRTAFYTNAPLQLRYTASGDGTKQWTATDASVTSFDEPEISAGSDTLLGFAATLTTEDFAWAAAVLMAVEAAPA